MKLPFQKLEVGCSNPKDSFVQGKTLVERGCVGGALSRIKNRLNVCLMI